MRVGESAHLEQRLDCLRVCERLHLVDELIESGNRSSKPYGDVSGRLVLACPHDWFFQSEAERRVRIWSDHDGYAAVPKASSWMFFTSGGKSFGLPLPSDQFKAALASGYQ